MKKQIIFTPQARHYLKDLPDPVKAEFNANFTVLSETGRLEFPDGRKLQNGLFEVRVAMGGNAYRTIYCYAHQNEIWILNGFTKKTQKTPERELDKALAIMRRNGL